MAFFTANLICVNVEKGCIHNNSDVMRYMHLWNNLSETKIVQQRERGGIGHAHVNAYACWFAEADVDCFGRVRNSVQVWLHCFSGLWRELDINGKHVASTLGKIWQAIYEYDEH